MGSFQKVKEHLLSNSDSSDSDEVVKLDSKFSVKLSMFSCLQQLRFCEATFSTEKAKIFTVQIWSSFYFILNADT